MLQKFNITIPELSGDMERRAYVYLPESYETRTQRRYPVLYMFDGHNVFLDEDATFGKSWGLGDYLDYTETQLIVVAIECNCEGNNRLMEYSPYSFTDGSLGSIRGRGDKTMHWFINTLKPMIDGEYRTLPDRANTFIAGSSMGGLMSLYAVLRYNKIFGRAAALSPSVWTNPEKIYRLIDTARLRRDTILYMDYGTKELGNHDDMLNLYTEVTARLMRRRVMLNSRLVPWGNHSEASWQAQLPFMLDTLMYGTGYDDPEPEDGEEGEED